MCEHLREQVIQTQIDEPLRSPTSWTKITQLSSTMFQTKLTSSLAIVLISQMKVAQLTFNGWDAAATRTIAHACGVRNTENQFRQRRHLNGAGIGDHIYDDGESRNILMLFWWDLNSSLWMKHSAPARKQQSTHHIHIHWLLFIDWNQYNDLLDRPLYSSISMLNFDTSHKSVA